jgi:hypothetical protein
MAYADRLGLRIAAGDHREVSTEPPQAAKVTRIAQALVDQPQDGYELRSETHYADARGASEALGNVGNLGILTG